MYWTDWGQRPMIGRSGMDGSDPTEFVSQNLHWPNGVTVDFSGGRLYWLDARSRKIETVKFDGSDRRLVLDDLNLQPFSIAVFENRLYWSNMIGNEIQSCNKFTGHDRKTVAREPVNRIYGLHVHHHLLQSPDAPNPCHGSMCSDLCLLSPSASGLGYTCACPEGKTLRRWTCSENRNRQILVAGCKNVLFVIKLVSLGRHKVEKFQLDLERISAVTFNRREESVVIFDSSTRSLYSYSLARKQLNILLSYGLGHIPAVHYDEFGHNLYWCDWNLLTVVAMSLTTGSKTVITSRKYLETPIDIALVPEKGFMFVAYQVSNKYTYIDRMSMSGSATTTQRFLDLDSGAMSLRMHYSRKMQRLFWIDILGNRIESVNLYGTDRRTEAVGDVLWNSLTSVGDTLFWSLWDSPNIRYLNVVSSRNNQTLNLPCSFDKTEGVQLASGILDGDIIQSPCGTKNGNCSHLCLMAEEKKQCACPFGLSLSIDSANCVKPRTCSPKEFECSTGECIPMEQLCDRHQDCIHGDDEVVSNCDGIKCPEEQFLCSDKKKCIDRALKCNGHPDCEDGSDELCHRNCTAGTCLASFANDG